MPALERSIQSFISLSRKEARTETRCFHRPPSYFEIATTSSVRWMPTCCSHLNVLVSPVFLEFEAHAAAEGHADRRNAESAFQLQTGGMSVHCLLSPLHQERGGTWQGVAATSLARGCLWHLTEPASATAGRGTSARVWLPQLSPLPCHHLPRSCLWHLPTSSRSTSARVWHSSRFRTSCPALVWNSGSTTTAPQEAAAPTWDA